MKKILAIIVCTILVMSASIVVASAEDDSLPSVEVTEPSVEDSPTIEETPTEDEFEASEDVTEPEVTEPEVTTPLVTAPEATEPTPNVTEPAPDAEPKWEEVKETISDKIVNWILPHIEEISVIITLLLSIFYNIRKHKLLNRSIGTLNNNAVAIAQSSSTAVGGISATVSGYQSAMDTALAEIRQNAMEKQKLEATLAEVHTFLKTSKLANVELANEVAELLVLANIPNSKKEELYSRHRAAVDAITASERTEVNTDDNIPEE